MDIIEYSKTFNCCGKSYLSQLEYIKIEYYKLIFNKDIEFKNNEYRKELFGILDNNWDNVNKIHWLWSLLSMIYRYKKRYYNQYLMGTIKYEDIPDDSYYIKEFNLECIRKTMNCIGIDILPLLKLVDLNYKIIYKDGIDYMAIVPNISTSPDFRVN